MLNQGYNVRASVRSLSKSGEVRSAVHPHLFDSSNLDSRLTFVELDLEKDSGWEIALKGADVLMHTASPFPLTSPKDENDLIRPAVEGTLRALRAAKNAGVKPIIGIEAYVAPGSRHERKRVKWAEGGEDDVSGGGAYTHMTILAENNVGLHNLFRLSSLASLEGYYYKPRFDRELLETYAKGIIGTTGCPSGEVNRWLQAGNYDQALAVAGDLRDIFGPRRSLPQNWPPAQRKKWARRGSPTCST